jgi:DNA-binding LacI/PurR family transcriptional regulator
LKAAEKLGYEPNVIARSLIMKRSNLIGILMADWVNPFYTTMLRQFSEKLREHGYQLMLMTVNTEDDVDSTLRQLLQYQVDGVIIVSALPSSKLGAQCVSKGIPIVLFNRRAPGIGASSVTGDDAAVGRQIAAALLGSGYRRLALIRGARKKGKIVANVADIFGYDAGRASVHNLMNGSSKPDAIVCSSDLTAIGVLDGARIDLGVVVPDELGIIGFGDAPAAHWASNDLTTVQLPVEEMIDLSIETLLARLQDPDLEPVSLTSSASIVFRGTTRAPKKQVFDQGRRQLPKDLPVEFVE